MINTKSAENLLDRYLSGNCSADERLLVEDIYHKTALKRAVIDKPVDFNRKGQESWKYIYQAIQDKPVSSNKLWLGLAAAASVLIFVAAGFWFYLISRPVVNLKSPVAYQNDIAPGKNMATLTLSNGKTIRLSEAQKGVVIGSSKLTYNDGSNVMPGAELSAQSGTLSTPLGGQYQLTLPDGTNVWLNSATRLSFSFLSGSSQARNVELHGEAYFEVSKNHNRPFIVKSERQEVHVLGTHFNVNGYAGRHGCITTLIEGTVRVVTPHDQAGAVLRPGEQSVSGPDKKVTVVPANIKQALAWKNGLFRFNAERIDQIMSQLARWYNIEVIFEGKLPDEKFSGNISRDKNISEVLNMLSYSNAVKFKIEGRRVTVMK